MREVSSDSPPGDLTVRLALPNRVMYSAARSSAGHLLRFPQLCDFVLSADGKLITCHSSPGIDEGLIAILLRGTVLSYVLGLSGHLVLHASAVAVDRGAVAFAGAAGMGKSTCAALMCAVGARLVSDDVLRVGLQPPRCHHGASGLRIRRSAASIVDLFEKPPEVGETADGRVLIRPDQGPREMPLTAVVVPSPRRDLGVVQVEGLRGSDAFSLLIRFGRVMGWQEQEIVRRQFAQVGQLIAEVPVLRADIPWGPPLEKSTADQLSDALMAQLPGAR